MQLTVNGNKELFPSVEVVSDLLRHYELPASRVAVEVNEELVTRAEYENSRLADGDRVEIVTFVGGG